jgi:hypothetical protein
MSTPFGTNAMNNPMNPVPVPFSLLTATFDGLNRSLASEVLTKALEAVKKTLPLINAEGIVLEAVALDHRSNTGGLVFSSIIVLGTLAGKRDFGANHVLLLADSGEPLSALTETTGALSYTVPRFEGDALDEAYKEAVLARTGALLDAGAQNISTHGLVVPRGFNFADEKALYDLIVTAVGPVVATLRQISSKSPILNLAALDKVTNAFDITVNTNEHQGTGYDGLPVRRDISITTMVTPRQRENANRSVHGGNTPRMFTKLGGYMDVIWAPVTPPVQGMGWIPAETLPTVKYTPRFVITEMENMITNSLPGQLMALATARALLDNRNWWAAFQQRPRMNSMAKGSVDMRDPGAFNIEGNLEGSAGYGSAIDTSTSTFTLVEMADMLSKLMHPEVLITLAVSRSGPDAWMNNPFVEAARGSTFAITEILRAADTLTGGEFAKYYGADPVSPVILTGNDQIGYQDVAHAGYYVDREGVKRDIRDIDYLALMNLRGHNTPELGAQYTDTQNRQEYNARIRLDRRARIIQECLGSSEVVFTDIYRLVNFTGKFSVALARAVAACGISTRINSSNPFTDYTSNRAELNWLRQAYGAQIGNVFQGNQQNFSTGSQFSSGPQW